MAKGKQKAIGANKQKDNALAELRQHRNGGVVIPNELELRIRQEKRNAEAKAAEKLKASCMGKAKQKSTCANKGKENAPAYCLPVESQPLAISRGKFSHALGFYQ